VRKNYREQADASIAREQNVPTRANTKHKLSRRDIMFWHAYFEILNERVPLVDKWSDELTTWHPRVVQKLLWYSGIRNTKANRHMALDWLMANVAVYNDEQREGAEPEKEKAKSANG
jgi:hypothetical protein